MVVSKKAVVMLMWQAHYWMTGTGATSQCESDGSAYLQRKVEGSSALATEYGFDESPTGACDGLEEGDCTGSDDCNQCTPDSDPETIPSGLRFPDGSLTCSGQQHCQSDSSTSPPDRWKFKDANDYQVCEGYATCYNSWLVENVGAACCSGYQVCYGKNEFKVGKEVPPDQPAATCKGDMCCSGYQNCYGGETQTVYEGLRDLSCRGEQTCVQMTAKLSRNLYCNPKSGATNPQSPSDDLSGPSTCKSSTSNFIFDAADESWSSHCVTCEAKDHDNVCGDSLFQFDTEDAKVAFNCDAKNGAADPICKAARITMNGANSLMELDCSSGGSSGACETAVVTVNGAGSFVELDCSSGSCKSAVLNMNGANSCLQLECASGACVDTVVNLAGTDASCACNGADSDACSKLKDAGGNSFTCSGLAENCPTNTIDVATICAERKACCDNEAGSANCADGCGCTAPTTTSTSTSGTTAFDPPPESTSTTTSGTSAFDPPPESTSTTMTGGGDGDPHIHTLDKQHYLLLKQGTFSLWRFAGQDAEVFSVKKLLKKLPVDFKIYTHYSGHTSYIKGLMLVDNSGARGKRVLELTSEDCTWRTKAGNSRAWTSVQKPQMLSMPDNEGDEMTAFKLTQSSKGEQMHVELLIKKRDGFSNVAKLFMRCKPGYHINTKISMTSKEYMKLVKGQLGAFGHTKAGEDFKASLLQGMRTRSDQEFLTNEKWTNLGGSEEAANYLNEVDEEGPSFLKVCSDQDKAKASDMCKKYLGDVPGDKSKAESYENRLDDCIFDVCNGGGTVAAELAAEIFEAD